MFDQWCVLPIRFDGVVKWDDLVKGVISISNLELDDLIIARSDGTPTYNFCVCVDDSDMQISHVIRGEEHVNNTPLADQPVSMRSVRTAARVLRTCR